MLKKLIFSWITVVFLISTGCRGIFSGFNRADDSKKTDPMLMLIGACYLTSGCGLTSVSNPPIPLAEIKALSEQLIIEIESTASPEQLSIFQEIINFVENYDYSSPVPTVALIVPYNLQPENESDLYRMVGFISMIKGGQSIALWSSAKALSLKPENKEALSQVGVILNEMSRPDEAVAFLEQAKYYAPNDDANRMSLAAAHAANGDIPSSLSEALAATKINPDSATFNNMLNQIIEQALALETDATALRNKFYSDINRHLADVAMINDYNALVAYQNGPLTTEANTASDELVTLFSAFPIPVGDSLTAESVIQILEPLFTEYTDAHSILYNTYLVTKSDTLLSNSLNKMDEVYSAMVDCLDPSLSYTCYVIAGAELYQYMKDIEYPEAYDISETYTKSAYSHLTRLERRALVELISISNRMSPEVKSWAYRYLYNYLTFQDLAITEGHFIPLVIPFMTRLQAEALLSGADAAYKAQIDAEMDAYRLELDARRQARAEAERDAAWAEAQATEKVSPDSKGELCLDSVGCLGFDGSTVSLKISAGPLFAQFTTDTSSFKLGVRVGVGANDPSGGNIGGADLSIGGTVSTTGTTFDVVANTSHTYGTGGSNYKLFSSKFNF